MKKNSFLWAALSMTAAFVMTACSNDDNANESPVQQNAAKTIPYTVTVNGGEGGATTRATVADDPSDATNYHKTLYFAAGDKLYITGTNIKGVLNIQTGMGETTGATFSGNLIYSGSGTPDSDLSLTATLVSAQQTDGSEVTINSTTGAVTVKYPTNAYCTSVNDAVQKYSNLTGTSTYSAKSFSLAQQTAFLNFEITFEDGTATGTALPAVVNNNSSDICTANVTTTTESTKVVAKFVLPVAKGTTLSSAKVTMGTKAAISFGASQVLDGKVYNVKKTQAAATAGHALSAAAVGEIVGTDGLAYAVADKGNLPTGVTAAGMVAYKSGTTGLAIALADEASTMNWSTANGTTTGAAAHTPTVTGQTWKLPSQAEWQQMFSANGGNQDSYTGLNTALAAAGGNSSKLQEEKYWSSSENDPGVRAYYVLLDYGDAYWSNGSEGFVFQVRACLAF